jgi:hypothetical protein
MCADGSALIWPENTGKLYTRIQVLGARGFFQRSLKSQPMPEL